MIHIVVLDFRACIVRKYMLDEPFSDSSEKVEQFLMEQGLNLGQCEWMTADTEILEETHVIPVKRKSVVVLGMKDGGTQVKKLDFYETDEAYDRDRFKNFDDYTAHYTVEAMQELNVLGYLVVSMGEKEAYDLLGKLGKSMS